MSDITVQVTYNGIAVVSQQDGSFVVELPYTWTGLTASPSLPTVSNTSPPVVELELDPLGNVLSPSQATLTVTGVNNHAFADGSGGDFEVGVSAANLQSETTAITYTVTLLLGLDFTSGNSIPTLNMTFGAVLTNPTTQSLSFPFLVSPAKSLLSHSLSEISSNTNFPAAAASLSAAGPMPMPMPAPIPVDTSVSIPVVVPSAPPAQNYLGIIFVVQMLFGSIMDGPFPFTSTKTSGNY